MARELPLRRARSAHVRKRTARNRHHGPQSACARVSLPGACRPGPPGGRPGRRGAIAGGPRPAQYVFDLGYYDYGWWARLDAAGCRIVTRFKTNTPLTVTAELPLPREAGNILSDRVGHLPARLRMSRRNPFADPVREISVTLDTGKVLRILTNDLDAPATEIAALYKRRWAIELFFRWVKQTLKIRHFLGRSENAVRIQIAVALLAWLLLRMARDDQTTISSPLAFARLVRTNLMHRKRTDALLRPPKSPATPSAQLAFEGFKC